MTFQTIDIAAPVQLSLLVARGVHYAAETRIEGFEDASGEVVPQAAFGLFVTADVPGSSALSLLLPAVQSAREAAK